MSLAKRAFEMKKTDPMRSRILSFLSGNVDDTLEGEFVYIGKSKKIQSRNVIILSETSDKYKIKDDFGNECVVSKSMVKKN